jgi:hypothetical protein
MNDTPDPREDALAKALRPFLLSIPHDMPDNILTECKTHNVDLSDDEVARIEEKIGKGALLSRKSNLILWFDGVTIGDFRRLREAFAALSAPPSQSEPKPWLVPGNDWRAAQSEPPSTPYVRPAADIQAEIERLREANDGARFMRDWVMDNDAKIDALNWTLTPPATTKETP